MEWLILILLVVGLTIAGLLVVGTLFLQGYLYTEVNPGVFWRGPAAGAIVTVFLFCWCLLNIQSPESRKRNMPFDTLFNVTGSVDLVKEPVPEMWVYEGKGKKPIHYKIHKDPLGKFERHDYREVGGNTDRRWSTKIKKIVIKTKPDDQEFVFERHDAASRGDYPYFISEEGWFMREYENGVNGQPSAFFVGLFLADLFLNFLHLAVWVLCLWLLLRFQFWHAVGLGFALWLAMTLLVVPYLLDVALPAQ